MENLIALGYISKAFGIKGAVAATLYNSDSATLMSQDSVVFRQGKNPDRTLLIKEIISGDRIFFDGINDRSEALSLVGGQIFVDRSKLPEPANDEFYLNDILGADVVLKNGEKVGTLEAFSSNSAQTLLEVKTVAGHTASVPMVKAIVIDIDLEAKRITIDPPEGLLELVD